MSQIMEANILQASFFCYPLESVTHYAGVNRLVFYIGEDKLIKSE